MRFYSRQAVRESLTGRIVSIELLPFTLSELAGEPLPRLVFSLLKARQFSASAIDLPRLSAPLQRTRLKLIDLYLSVGGLPGIAFVRNPRLRQERLMDQLQTILDRDIRLVYPTTLPYDRLLAFVRALAETEGEPIHPTSLRKITGIAEATQQKLLHALTSVFMIRLLPIEGDRRGFAIYFEDQAELNYLASEKSNPTQAFRSLVYRNLRGSFNYSLGMDARFFQYRSKAGSLVPFGIHSGPDTLGILPIQGGEPTRAELFAGQSFLRRYGSSKILFVTLGNREGRVMNERMLKIPSESLLFE